MSIRPTIIGCGIFQEEIEHLLAEENLDIDIHWLEVGLHDNIERLEEALEEASAERRGESREERLLFLYGSACLPEMKPFARKLEAETLPVRNCLAFLVGDEKLKQMEQNRTLVASPGWVRKMWLGRAGTVGGWTADDYRMQFGRYDLIVVLDAGLNPLTEEEIITCFDLVQVPIETYPCDPAYFRKLFLDFIEGQTAKIS